MKGKRLESSHLTEEERGQAIKYGTVATVLIAVSVLFYFMGWINSLVALCVFFIGWIIVAFIWGYIGTIEQERSKK